MADQYAYWRDALEGKFGPVHDGRPQPGFYRKRKFKGGPWQRVAIWPENGEMLALCDGARVDASEIWTWVCMNPITHELYTAVDGGATWPDDPGLGHNAPPADSDFETLEGQVAAALDLASRVKDIKDQDEADKAANLRDRLLELSKAADEKRRAEKKPHDDAAKAVQQKWLPLVDSPKAAAARLRGELTGYLQAEERRKAQEAAQAAEAGEAPPEVKAHAGGALGRKTGLRTITDIEIMDYAQALSALKDEADVREAVEKVARRRARAGVETPGVKRVEKRQAA